MSLIPCTDHCIYQQDGYCSLSRAASCAVSGTAVGCVNFVPRSQNRTECLTDVVHANQFKSIRND